MPNNAAYTPLLAYHYSAYRPPLHELILQRLLPNQPTFTTGLDIGCGTGYSTRALAPYCRQVFGVDPSTAMLKETKPSGNITYLAGCAEHTTVNSQLADIVTYAGSLFYADIALAAKELQRVAKPGAWVLVYDFAVMLEPFIHTHQLCVDATENTYNHRCNFASIAGFHHQAATLEQLSFAITAEQLAHLLLSEPQLYSAYAKRFNNANPHQPLQQLLLAEEAQHHVQANIFYTHYTL